MFLCVYCFRHTDALATDFFFRNLIDAALLAMLISGDGLLVALPVTDQSLPPNNCIEQIDIIESVIIIVQ